MIHTKIVIHKGNNYKQLWVAFMLLLCSSNAFSQFKVTFKIINSSALHLNDSVFVAGNFNKWLTNKYGTSFNKFTDTATIEINDLPYGDYQYKFTRGNWLSVETNKDGTDIIDREFTLIADTVITIDLIAWKDDFPAYIKKHTASVNVKIIDTAFVIPQLGRTRKIWIYLPPGYAKNNKRYPVMYMQDGQNIFDEQTASFGEWGVDESVDSLIQKGKPGCIIVGIESSINRLTEYNPYQFKDFGKGEGNQYVEFLVKNLKPFVDKHYRTLTTSENTIIAGSSMGGLISYYAMLKYPEVFGKGGIFSPAFYTANKIKELTISTGKNLKGTLFFYIGGKEGDKYVDEMELITDILGKNSSALIYTLTDAESLHNEKAWRKWFPEFYNWVLASGFNNVISLDDH